MDFYTIDVETANVDIDSICSIGIAGFLDGEVAFKESYLINPNDYFDDMNIHIHGITPDMVKDAPSFVDVMPALRTLLDGHILVCHTHFDKTSFYRASAKHNITNLDVTWLDSAKVVRRAWPEFAVRGYGLANISAEVGISFQHHDALEDAIACGKVLLAAVDKTNISVKEWVTKSTVSMYDMRLAQANQSEANMDGPLFGETITFTGSLSVPRADAVVFAASLGCEISKNVTKKTTLVVVGDQDVHKLAGKEKSNKHLKAEQLLEKGAAIRILKESDFMELMS